MTSRSTAGDISTNIEDYSVRWPTATRWEDNDHYGHVNNVKYYSYFDTAVNAWLMHATGIDIRTMPAVGLVAESTCTFRKELTFPETLTVGIAIQRLGTKSITYGLGLFTSQQGTLICAATCRFVHVYVDRITRRPVLIPDTIATVAARLIQGVAP